MNHEHIIIGKPETYEFVRGTSVENAIYLLENGIMKMNDDESYGKLDELFLCARYDFPRTHSFSKNFEATCEEDVLNETAGFAEDHSTYDFLNSHFKDIVGKFLFEEFSGPNHFFNTFEQELKTASIDVDYVRRIFYENVLRKGVRIYFNETLMDYNLHEDPEESYRESNSVHIKAKEVPISTVIAIEPLGKKDSQELEQIIDDLIG